MARQYVTALALSCISVGLCIVLACLMTSWNRTKSLSPWNEPSLHLAPPVQEILTFWVLKQCRKEASNRKWRKTLVLYKAVTKCLKCRNNLMAAELCGRSGDFQNLGGRTVTQPTMDIDPYLKFPTSYRVCNAWTNWHSLIVSSKWNISLDATLKSAVKQKFNHRWQQFVRIEFAILIGTAICLYFSDANSPTKF